MQAETQHSATGSIPDARQARCHDMHALCNAIPWTGVTTDHAGVATHLAAAISHKSIKVFDGLDVVDMVRMIGANHWQRLSNSTSLLQHVKNLQFKQC